MSRVYFDFGDMIKANPSGYFPYTPSVPMLYGLREAVNVLLVQSLVEQDVHRLPSVPMLYGLGGAVNVLLEEGLDGVFARHHRLAEGVRAAVKAWGLRLCARAPKWYSDTVSAILVPEGINGADVIDVAFRRYNLALGAGLARLAGKLFRIGHLGDLNELMLAGAIAGAEMAMRDVGVKIALGPREAGASPATRWWRVCWSTIGGSAARRAASG